MRRVKKLMLVKFSPARSRYFDIWYWARTRDKASHDSIPIPLGYCGHHEFESSTAEDPPCRKAMPVKSVELKRPLVGVEGRREGASSGVILVT
ncbi:hypothetical protein TNCV_3430301 [Trichonephila clavipes]|nr:hypothetical protein TNCV_3430301 [Trichonephila clavipes]